MIDHVLLHYQGVNKSLFSIHSANQYVNIGFLMLSRTVCRFSSMHAKVLGRAPLVAVVGATGTGKSEVSLAHFWCVQEILEE